MIQLRVTPTFHGPTILELESILPDIEASEVEVRWEGTKPEFSVLARNSSQRIFVLHVPDMMSLEKAANSLGLPIPLEQATIDTARQSLISRKNYNWRPMTQTLGSSLAKNTVLRLTADALRRGNNPATAGLAIDCILDGTNPIDADVFLRLRAMRC